MDEMMLLLDMFTGTPADQLAEYAKNTILAYQAGNITKCEMLLKLQLITHVVSMDY